MELNPIAGELTVLLGPSGCGKSTLLRSCFDPSEAVLLRDSLSVHGMRPRRVALQHATADSAPTVLADELTTGISPADRDELMAQLREMADGLGRAVVLATEDEEVAAWAHRVIVLSPGAWQTAEKGVALTG